MLSVSDWWAELAHSEGAWLIIGKGPSLEQQPLPHPDAFHRLALNHAVTRQPVLAASVVDLAVIADCGPAIRDNARYLVMPRHPHRDFKPTPEPLEHYFGDYPLLAELAGAGRLVWYNFFNAPVHPGAPVVPRGRFSAEVMVNLLALLGVRRIRTLGVDGGTGYASGFDPADHLANRHRSFDVQWAGIARKVRQYRIDYAPLGTETPIRVYIGTDASQRLGARVLDYSLQRHTPTPVLCDTMDAVTPPTPRDPTNQARTEFSFKRFAIPKLAGHRGRAVYLDADMLVLRNFLELWNTPFEGATVLHAASSDPGRPAQFSVMLLDCETLDWDLHGIIAGLDRGEYDYGGLMRDLCIESPERVRPAIPAEWNSLERVEPGRTGLVHYTDMRTQPWVSSRNANGDLWVSYLRDALDEGFIQWQEVEEAVRQGYARPSLRGQLRLRRRYWGVYQRVLGRLLDGRYKPHKALHKRLKAERETSSL